LPRLSKYNPFALSLSKGVLPFARSGRPSASSGRTGIS